MKKNIKRYLSYVLGVILAMGLGLSYAYAVGANDSNAFVTTTEWETKVAQIEASLDNVTKTINDTNMDFVLNGPRFQVSLIDGFENRGTAFEVVSFGNRVFKNATLSSGLNLRFSMGNNLNIYDTWDGRQIVAQKNWYNGDTTNDVYEVTARFAVQSTDPNVYLCVSLYAFGGNNDSYPNRIWISQYSYHDLTKQLDNFATAKTVTVTLPLSEWWPIYDNQPPSAFTETSSYVYTGKTGADYEFPTQLQWNANNSASMYNLSNPGTGYVSRSATSTHVTFTFKFPANANIIRHNNLSAPYAVWNVLPKNMRGRKFGGPNDVLPHSNSITSASARSIAKVYSPTKGCLALKSFLNGEIPILNE